MSWTATSWRFLIFVALVVLVFGPVFCGRGGALAVEGVVVFFLVRSVTSVKLHKPLEHLLGGGLCEAVRDEGLVFGEIDASRVANQVLADLSVAQLGQFCVKVGLHLHGRALV